jgi:hypothetical protein
MKGVLFMKVIPRNILSALLTTVFAVVAITGVMMFFKIRPLSTELIHIWLGLGFTVISVLHLLKNWTGFVSYFKKSSTVLSIGAGVIVTALFIVVPLVGGGSEKGVNPKGMVIGALMNQPIEKVATFLDMDGEAMVKRLSDQAQISVSSKQSIIQIAKANNKNNDEILGILFQK